MERSKDDGIVPPDNFEGVGTPSPSTRALLSKPGSPPRLRAGHIFRGFEFQVPDAPEGMHWGPSDQRGSYVLRHDEPNAQPAVDERADHLPTTIHQGASPPHRPTGRSQILVNDHPSTQDLRRLFERRGQGGLLPQESIHRLMRISQHHCREGPFIWLKTNHQFLFDDEPVRGWERGLLLRHQGIR